MSAGSRTGPVRKNSQTASRRKTRDLGHKGASAGPARNIAGRFFTAFGDIVASEYEGKYDAQIAD